MEYTEALLFARFVCNDTDPVQTRYNTIIFISKMLTKSLNSSSGGGGHGVNFVS